MSVKFVDFSSKKSLKKIHPLALLGQKLEILFSPKLVMFLQSDEDHPLQRTIPFLQNVRDFVMYIYFY